jgi:transcriptional regulator with XRE-family HTH domain
MPRQKSTHVDDPAAVGLRLKAARERVGLSQRQLAFAGCTAAYLSRIEAGQRQPSLKVLRILAAKLETTPHYLETGEEVPAAKERELRLSDAELELRLGRDLQRAETILNEVIAAEADDGVEARARAALGLLAAQRGDNAEAIRQLKTATQSSHVRPEQRSDAFEALAAAYVAVGEPWKAVSLLEECIEAVNERAPEDVTLSVRYRSILGTTFSSFGEVERARAVLAEALTLAEGYDIPSARMILYWSLGRLAWMKTDSDAALDYMARARGLLEASEDTAQLARANLVSGQICNLDNRLEEAADYLEQAERLLVLGGDKDDLGILRAEQAKLTAKTNEPEQALALAHEAMAALEDDVRYAPTAWHALGLAHAAADDLPAAEDAFSRAVDGLAQLRQWRQAAQAARDWANTLRAAGRGDDAYNLFERALFLTLREETATG